MTKSKKIMIYVGAVITTISSLVVIAAGMALMSLYDMSAIEAAIFWLNTPLLSGVLSTAMIIALSAVSMPVLACVWFIKELTRSNSHNCGITPAPLMPYRSAGTLNSSGSTAREELVDFSIDPQGNSMLE